MKFLGLLAALLPLSTAAAGPVQSGPAGFYRGRINPDREVALQLKLDKGQVSGRYFNIKVGRDVLFKGAFNASGELVLQELSVAPKVPAGVWKGRFTSTGGIAGRWKSVKGIETSFQLSRLRDEADFELLRPAGAGTVIPVAVPSSSPSAAPGAHPPTVSAIELSAGPEVIQGGVGYRMTPVRGTNLLVPMLTRLRDKKALGMINGEIERVSSKWKCPPAAQHSKSGAEDAAEHDFNVETEVSYLSDELFSIRASGNYFCGGEGPTNNANFDMSFDLRTGMPVRFETLFKDYLNQKSAILGLIFSYEIEQAKRQGASTKTVDPEESGVGEGRCVAEFTLQRLVQSTFAFHFSKEGLSVQPKWPRAIESCADLVTVPYQEVRKFAAPNSPLARAR